MGRPTRTDNQTRNKYLYDYKYFLRAKIKLVTAGVQAPTRHTHHYVNRSGPTKNLSFMNYIHIYHALLSLDIDTYLLCITMCIFLYQLQSCVEIFFLYKSVIHVTNSKFICNRQTKIIFNIFILLEKRYYPVCVCTYYTDFTSLYKVKPFGLSSFKEGTVNNSSRY